MQEIHFIDVTGCPGSFGMTTVQHGGQTKLIVNAGGHSRLVVCERDKDAAETKKIVSWKSTRIELGAQVGGGDIVGVAAHSRAIPHPPVIAVLSVPSQSVSAPPTAANSTTAAAATPPTPTMAPPAAGGGRLSIFGARVVASDSTMSAVFSDAQSIPLSFVPVCLVRIDVRRAQGFLVSGSDGSLHMISVPEAASTSPPPSPSPSPPPPAAAATATTTVMTMEPQEIPLAQCLPELCGVQGMSGSSVVLSVSVTVVGTKRLTACGCANGMVLISVTDEFGPESMGTSREQLPSPPQVVFLDGAISSVSFFQSERVIPNASELHRGACGVVNRAESHSAKSLPSNSAAMRVLNRSDESSSSSPSATSTVAAAATTSKRSMGVVIGGALGFIANIPNVMVDGKLTPQLQPTLVPMPGGSDAVTCVAAMDIDSDGQMEIVATTFSNTLLVFGPTATTTAAPATTTATATGGGGTSAGTLSLKWSQRFPSPLLSVRSANLTGDAIEELAVLGWKGCHILQPDLGALRSRVLAELNALVEIRKLEIEVSQLEQS